MKILNPKLNPKNEVTIRFINKQIDRMKAGKMYSKVPKEVYEMLLKQENEIKETFKVRELNYEK